MTEVKGASRAATMALAAKYHNVLIVAAGTTTGMMIANIPAVFLGQGITRVLPVKVLRVGAALIYVALGVLGIAQTARLTG